MRVDFLLCSSEGASDPGLDDCAGVGPRYAVDRERSKSLPHETRRVAILSCPSTAASIKVKAVLISPTMWFKCNAPVLGDFEQLVLLGVLRLELQDSTYGAAIRQEIHARSRRDVSINAVYTTLDRLESKGFLKS